jgi:hypothetical protein
MVVVCLHQTHSFVVSFLLTTLRPKETMSFKAIEVRIRSDEDFASVKEGLNRSAT